MSPLYLSVILIIATFLPPTLGQYGPLPSKGKKHRTTTTTESPDFGGQDLQPGFINSISSTPLPDNSLGSFQPGTSPQGGTGGTKWWQNPDSPFSGVTAAQPSGQNPPSPGHGPQPQPGGCGGASGGGCGGSLPPTNFEGNPFLGGLKPGGGAPPPPVTPSGQAVACSSSGYTCAPKHLCRNGVVIDDGQGLFQVRSDVQYCDAATQVCCRLPPSSPSGCGGFGANCGPNFPTPSGPQPQQPGLIHVTPTPSQPGLIHVTPSQPSSGGHSNAGSGLIHVPPSQRPSVPSNGAQFPSASIPSPTYAPGNNLGQPRPIPGTNGVPIGGSIYDNIPATQNPQHPYTGPLNTTPHPGCAAALKCVPESYCTVEGVMSDQPVSLTREQYENKVPLSDCADPDTGVLGKCCRDPNYKDPWPGGMMMMKNGGAPQHQQHQNQPDECGAGASCLHPYQCSDERKIQPIRNCRVPLDGASGMCCANDQSAFPRGQQQGGAFIPGTTPIPQKPNKKPITGYPSPKPFPSSQPFPQQFPTQPFPQQKPGVQPFPQQVPSSQPFPQQKPGVQPFPQQVPSSQPFPQQKPGVQPFPSQSSPQQFPTPQPSQPVSSVHPGQPQFPQQQSHFPSPQPGQPQSQFPSSQPHPTQPQPQYPSSQPHPGQPQSQFPSSQPHPTQPQPQFPSSQPHPSQPQSQFPSSQPRPTQPQPLFPSSQPHPSQPQSQFPSSQPRPTQPQPQFPSSQPHPSQPQSQFPSSQPHPTQSQPQFPSSQQQFPSPQPSQPQPQFPSSQPHPGQPQSQFPSSQPHPTRPQPQFPSSQQQFPSPQPSQPQPQFPSSQPSRPQTGYPQPGQASPTPGAECGIRRQVPRQGLTDVDAGFGEFPWHALVVSNLNKSALCSAAIISETAVVTAAHCLHNVESSDISVQAGVWKLHSRNQPKPVQVVPAAAIARHPSFDAGSLFNDLAVILLSHPLNFDQHIDKICLPPRGQDVPQYQRTCIATGWGKGPLQGNIPDSILHQVTVSLVPRATCEDKLRQTHLGRYFILNQSFQCAIPTVPAQDLCKVDVGGPIACDRGDGHHELTGTYSWDVGCTAADSPTVFGGIDTAWIESILGRPVNDVVRDELNEILKQQQQQELGGVDTESKPGFSQGYGKK